MFRSMASDVSALSSSVANGHQTLHLVSPTPSKIPYGGFSPVRLQTRLMPRPPSPARPRWLIGRHCWYLGLRRWIRNRSCDQAAPQTSDLNHGSSGLGSPVGCVVQPDLSLLWPHLRLCRPPSGLCFIPSGCETNSLAAEGPHFTLPILSPRAAACTPVIPESALDDIFLPDIGLRHVLSGSAITLFHVFRIAWFVLRGFCDVRLTLRPSGVACPAPARTFTTELS
jgi:hypothetical protein